MGKVLFGLSVSLDGFIADNHGDPSQVFAWMGKAEERNAMKNGVLTSDPPKIEATSARLSIVAAVATLLLLASLHVLSPEFDPSFCMVSEYATTGNATAQAAPFTLELKKVTLAERARLTQMLGVAIPDAWPGADMLEALPFFIGAMEKDPLGLVWDGIIIHKADQIAIGGIGFHGPPDEAGRVEIGYNIIPAYEGQGYATEMARRVIDWAFQTPRIQVITAECLDDNIGSIRVLEKVGMRRLAAEGNKLKWELQK